MKAFSNTRDFFRSLAPMRFQIQFAIVVVYTDNHSVEPTEPAKDIATDAVVRRKADQGIEFESH